MILAKSKGMTTRRNNRKIDWRAVVLVVVATLGAFQGNAGRSVKVASKAAISREVTL